MSEPVLRIHLPEQVWLDLEPASFASRALAFMTDFVLRWTIFFLIIATLLLTLAYLLPQGAAWLDLAQFLPNFSGDFDWLVVAYVILIFLIEWTYPIYFEVRHNGQTPGKRLMGLRVVSEEGLPINFRSSFLRTLFLIIDFFPAMGFVGLLSILGTRKAQRLGDLAARTLVLHNISRSESADLQYSASGDALTISPNLYRALLQYLENQDRFTPEAHQLVAQKLCTSLSREVQFPDQRFETYEQMNNYLRGIAQRARPRKAFIEQDETHSDHAELIQEPDWPLIREQIEVAEKAIQGLEDGNERSSDEIWRIAANYQQLCQRYAYLASFYPDAPETHRASILVRQGRRGIYGTRLERLRESSQGFLYQVRESFALIVRPTMFAFSLFLISGILSYLAVTINPNLMWSFLSEDAAAQLTRGQLWTESIQGMSSIAASQITTNNISVCLTAVAFGASAGIGTLFIVIMNGAMIGGIFSALGRFDMDTRLLDFIWAHGVLELSVIFVSAGCGLYIGDAMLKPGNRSRKEAFQQRCSDIVPVLLFSAGSLIVAGLVEGYVSPYPVPTILKAVLGICLGVGYWALLRSPQAKIPPRD